MSCHDDLLAALTVRPVVRPGLLCDAATLHGLRGRHLGHDRRARLAARIVAEAEAMAALPLPTRAMEGIRLLDVSRCVVRRVLTLAWAWVLTGEHGHGRLAVGIMRAAAGFDDWNPSHFLDVAEMATALALGLDLLHGQLAADDVAVIQTALIEHALRPGLEDAWWVRGHNNWNQVCHGGLVLAALAVRDCAPDLAQATIAQALACTSSGLAAYAPDGVYPEGPVYWEYGTTYTVLTSIALAAALGTDGGLSAAPGFAASADFMVQAQAPSGLLFNFSDGGRGDATSVNPPLFWFAQQYRRPELVSRQMAPLDRLLAGPVQVAGRDPRFLPLLLLWLTDDERPVDLPRSWQGDGVNPVAMHRSAWHQQASWVGIKGGSPSAPHGHMDAGAVIVEMAGQRWIEDLGADDYHSLEQAGIHIWDGAPGGQRWSVLRHHNRAHATLTVDDQGQVVTARAAIVRHGDGKGGRFTILDLSAIYAGQLDQARRGVRLEPDGRVIIRDEFCAPVGHTITAGLPTMATVMAVDARCLRLCQQGVEVCLHIDEPVEAAWQVGDLQPARSCEQANDGLSRCVVSLPSTGERQAIQVSIQVAQTEPSRCVPLDAW